MDSKTHLDGDDHRECSNFDYLSPIVEENSYPNDIFAKNIDVFSGPKNIIPIKEHANGPNKSYLHMFKICIQSVNGLTTSSNFELLMDRMTQFKIDA